MLERDRIDYTYEQDRPIEYMGDLDSNLHHGDDLVLDLTFNFAGSAAQPLRPLYVGQT